MTACAGCVYEAVGGPGAGVGTGLEGQRRPQVCVPGFSLAGGVRVAVGVKQLRPTMVAASFLPAKGFLP